MQPEENILRTDTILVIANLFCCGNISVEVRTNKNSGLGVTRPEKLQCRFVVV